MTSQQPDNASAAPVPGKASTTPTSLTIHADKPSGPTLGTRLIIFSALLLPSAVIPLLVLRRGVNNLHLKIDELKGATSSLHREFRSVMLELSVRREQHEQLRAMIAETREDLAHMREETQRVQMARASRDVWMGNQLQELAASNRTQISHLRELGTSLADVAAFMQEIELQQGFFTPKVDGRGIERLRFLAMQLEGMGKTNAADTDKKSSAADNLQHSSDSDVGRRD